jgi:hypothetical protein
MRLMALGWIIVPLGAALAAPTYSVRHEPVVSLRIDVLDVRGEDTETLGSRDLDVSPTTGGQLKFDIPWDPSGLRATIVLDATATPGNESTPHRVTLHSAVSARGRRVVSNRDLAIREAGTQLVAIYEDDARRLVLAIHAEAGSRPMLDVGEPVAVGEPVRLRVEVERVDGERLVALETNSLNTFVGQSVEYSFRRGTGSVAESVILIMTPERLAGDVAEIAVEVTGSLPGDPDRLLLARRETIVSSRGSTSALTVVSGEPAAGYRFRITPEF